MRGEPSHQEGGIIMKDGDQHDYPKLTYDKNDLTHSSQ